MVIYGLFLLYDYLLLPCFNSLYHGCPSSTVFVNLSVDAALAELDSIPDEVCEAGDVEEEDEEEEEWSYYRMDLQTQPQVSQSLPLHTLAFHCVCCFS